MDIQQYLKGKKELQKEVLFLVSEEQTSESPDFTKLNQYIDDQQIRENPNEFISFLFLILSIANCHHRSPHFFEIIDQILLMFTSEFHKYLTNSEIFNIFYNNKRILLFLLQHKLMYIEPIFSNLSEFQIRSKFPHYFFNEFDTFLDEDIQNEIEEEIEMIDKDPETYRKNRENGENETYLCQLIRKDSIDDFIIHVNKRNLSLNMTIPTSIFETNLYLFSKEPTLIEYSAYFGSIQIFNYLRLNNVKMNSNLWLCAIHGGNGEIIHLLEESNIQPPDNSYEQCLMESIDCHHNEIANYFVNKYLDQNTIFKNESIISQIIVSYNYEFFPDDFSEDIYFFNFCRIANYTLAEYMLKTKNINIDCKKKIKISNEYVLTPFSIAVRNSQTKIIELLINRKEIDVNSIANDFVWSKHERISSPLLNTIWMNNIIVAKLLLNHPKINVNMKCYDKEFQDDNSVYVIERIPLIETIYPPNFEMFKLILSHKNIDVNQSCLSYDSFPDIIEMNYNVTPLFRAIQKADIEFVKLLLSHQKINVNLMSEIKLDDIEINGNSLCFSIFLDKYDIAKLLLSHPNIDVNDKIMFKSLDDSSVVEKNALYLAIEKENEDFVKLLLKHPNIDVNFMSSDNNSLNVKTIKILSLHKAIQISNIEIVKLLLNNSKIDINLKSTIQTSDKNIIEREELTSLDYAINNDNVEIVKLLLSKQNIDFNSKSTKFSVTKNSQFFEEKTPLEISIEHENIEIFKLLLDYLLKNENPTKEFLSKLSENSRNEQIKSLILHSIK